MRLVIPVITGRDVNEHEWECDWVYEVLPPFIPPQPLALSELGEGVVVVGGGGRWYMVLLIVVPKLLLHPILSSPFLWMFWMNVAWKDPG